MNDHARSRDELARQADAARNRLGRVIAELDRRRHEAVDVRHQFESHVRELALAGGLVLLATAGAVGWLAHRIATAAERRRRARWRLARQMWMHPDRAMRAERKPFFLELGRAWLLSILTATLARPARAFVDELLERGRARMALPPGSKVPALSAAPLPGTLPGSAR